LSNFEHHLRRRLEAEDSKILESDFIELEFRVIGLEFNEASLQRILRCPTCGVIILIRTTTTKIRLIAERLPSSNSRKRLAMRPNLNPERN
jgi:DNA-directed RNA polymerase subunit RPC12/RpoP